MSAKLYYLDLHGRAELIRMLLHSQGIEFTEERFQPQELGEFASRGVAEFQKVPALEIDGKSLVESRAIERYLLAKAGHIVTDPHEGYLNDSLVGVVDDARNTLIRMIYFESNLAGGQDFIRAELPFVFKQFENRINEHGNFVNEKIQHADWVAFELIYDFLLAPKYNEFGKIFLQSNAPKLLEWAERFLENDTRLKEYLQTRPDRPI